MIKTREVKHIRTGMLCRVIKHDTHLTSQYNDYVVIKGPLGPTGYFVEGINLKTLKKHHYAIDDLVEIYV